MGLSMLIVLPLGILCFMSMFSGYNEKFQRTVTSTKALNDTAVEYIGGIEVIKAFGQPKTSYAKFVFTAKEGADCIFVVNHGEIVQKGTHDEPADVDRLYRRFVVERKQAAGWKV